MSSVIRDIVVRYKLFDKVIEQIVIPEDDVFRLISENFQAKDILKRYSIFLPTIFHLSLFTYFAFIYILCEKK